MSLKAVYDTVIFSYERKTRNKVVILLRLQSQYDTVKPVRNDHLYNKIYCLWFIQ